MRIKYEGASKAELVSKGEALKSMVCCDSYRRTPVLIGHPVSVSRAKFWESLSSWRTNCFIAAIGLCGFLIVLDQFSHRDGSGFQERIGAMKKV